MLYLLNALQLFSTVALLVVPETADKLAVVVVVVVVVVFVAVVVSLAAAVVVAVADGERVECLFVVAVFGMKNKAGYM